MDNFKTLIKSAWTLTKFCFYSSTDSGHFGISELAGVVVLCLSCLAVAVSYRLAGDNEVTTVLTPSYSDASFDCFVDEIKTDRASSTNKSQLVKITYMPVIPATRALCLRS